jgi:hypothetical protein
VQVSLCGRPSIHHEAHEDPEDPEDPEGELNRSLKLFMFLLISAVKKSLREPALEAAISSAAGPEADCWRWGFLLFDLPLPFYMVP